MKAAIADSTTGAIRRVLDAPTWESIALNQDSDEVVVEIVDRASDQSHYVDIGSMSLLEKKSIDPTVSTKMGKVALSGLPDPVVVIWGGQSAEAAGGEATIAFDEPGEYTLRLEAEPEYVAHELTVTIP